MAYLFYCGLVSGCDLSTFRILQISLLLKS
jgi:hypothetical protein